jgi:uncharacterized membrane protein YhaH (DUF805 family)
MDFLTAIKTCFSKYATFEGRARRSEFWYWFLFTFVLGLVVGWIPVVGWIVSLGLLCPNIAVEVRRLHDTGRSGWWWFLCLIPIIGVIALLVICATDSKPGSNEYGPNPKE